MTEATEPVFSPPLPDAPEDTVAASPAIAPEPGNPIALGLVLIALGCAVLGYVSWVESAWLSAVPWGNALARVDERPVPEGARAAHIRKLPREALPEDSPLVAGVRTAFRDTGTPVEDMDQVISLLGGTLAESVIMFPATDEELSKIIESGRLPKPGQPEVLRGDLARVDSFQLDGETFHVVGRVKPGVGGTTFAYLLPEDAAMAAKHFGPLTNGHPGWFAPDTSTLPAEDKGKGITNKGKEAQAFHEQPVAQTRTRPAYTAGSFIGLLLGATGGYFLHAGIFRRRAQRGKWLFGAICGEIAARPRLFLWMHFLLYGSFFFAMLRGWQLPLNNLAIGQFVASEFTSGGLRYIGDAYASGHILEATWATFRNNYLLQTLGFTFALSVIPLALGILKTVFSFVLTGFTMVPMWTGAATGYTFHSITMVLELEAYIVACFAVAVWTTSVYQSFYHVFTSKGTGPTLGHVVRGYFEAAVLTGIMLAIAAAYEATTLIFFAGR